MDIYAEMQLPFAKVANNNEKCKDYIAFLPENRKKCHLRSIMRMILSFYYLRKMNKFAKSDSCMKSVAGLKLTSIISA